MRLSATERIIRDAEEQDDVTTLSPGNRGAGDALPNVDVDLGEMDDGDDQEGATLVDSERVAIALKELRSYGVPPARAPSNTTGSYGVPPALSSSSARASGPPRPASWSDFQGLSPPPALPRPVSAPVSSAPAGPTLRGAGGFPTGLPRTLMRGSATIAAPAAPTHRELGPDVFLIPPSPAVLPGPSASAGRRYRGILIVCVTAAVVALGVGAWTAHWGDPVSTAATGDTHAKVGGPASRPKAAFRTIVSPMVVQTVPGPAAAPTPPAKGIADQRPEVAPAGADRSPSAAKPAASAASHRSHASGVKSKPRIVRKQTAAKTIAKTIGKTSQRKPQAGKTAAARVRSTRGGIPANPAKGRVPEARQSSADPDATLPITD